MVKKNDFSSIFYTLSIANVDIYKDGNSFANMAQSLSGRIYYYVLLIYLFNIKTAQVPELLSYYYYIKCIKNPNKIL